MISPRLFIWSIMIVVAVSALALLQSAYSTTQVANLSNSIITQTQMVVKMPNRKSINPDDAMAPETASECFVRLGCKNSSIQQCYRCCLGCDSRNQTACQDLCDGSTAALTGWTVEQVALLRINRAEYMNAVHEMFDAEHTVQNAHRLDYLYVIGTEETLADTRCTVVIAAGAIPNVMDNEAADIYEAVLQSALKDDRDPAIRRTALACLTTAWGEDSIRAMEEVTNAALNDEDESVRNLAVRLMGRWIR